MPEGDTVWNTARVLHRALAGARLTGSDFRVPQLATTDLTGWTVRESASRGKHLLLRLGRAAATATDWTLHSHLRMDGAWRAYAPGERWSGRPAHLIRVVLRSPGAVAVGYHLHELALVPDRRGGGPASGTSAPTCSARTGTRPRRSAGSPPHPEQTIGEALLDQRNLAGVGNLYKCELLFLRGRVAVDAGRRGARPGRHGDPGPAAAGRQPGPLDAEHHRLAAPGRDQLRVRPAGAAVPPLRHRDPQGGAGRAGHLLVPGLPARHRRFDVRTDHGPPVDRGHPEIRTIG